MWSADKQEMVGARSDWLSQCPLKDVMPSTVGTWGSSQALGEALCDERQAIYSQRINCQPPVGKERKETNR